MTPGYGEAIDLLSKIGNPILLFIVGAVLVASMLSERIAKILGPLGRVGRWWQTRQERAEADAQAVYRARRDALEEVASDRLEYLTTRMERMSAAMARLEEENEGLRDKLGRALDELAVVHRTLDAQSRDVSAIRRTLDTDERLAILRPPPLVGRHASVPVPPLPKRNGGDEPDTARIYP